MNTVMKLASSFGCIIKIKIVLCFLVLCQALLLLAKSCKVHVNNLSASRGFVSQVFLVLIK